MTTVFAELTASEATDFRELVRRLADGKFLTADDCRPILQGAGKSAADLKKAVDLLARRRRLAATAEAGATADVDSERCSREIEQAAIEHQRQREALDQQHARDVAELVCQRETALQLLTERKQALRELRSCVTDQAAIRRIARAKADAAQADGDYQRARDELKSVQALITSINETSRMDDGLHPDTVARRAALQARIPGIEEQIRETSARRDQLLETANNVEVEESCNPEN